MSSIAQELDATLAGLEPASAATLTSMVRDAMRRVRGGTAGVSPSPDLQRWQQRLDTHGRQLATSRQGAPLQEVMDDLRS